VEVCYADGATNTIVLGELSNGQSFDRFELGEARLAFDRCDERRRRDRRPFGCLSPACGSISGNRHPTIQEQGISMQAASQPWLIWALLAAIFAAMTAVLAKIGVSDVNSNYATFLRTVVVVLALGLLVWKTGETQPLSTLSPRTIVFLVLSGLATGASWLCYFKALQLGNVSQVAPIAKLSVVFVALIGGVFLGETLSALAWVGIFFIGAGAILVAVA
jgi:transporter family protein